jgi:hypothetical protein
MKKILRKALLLTAVMAVGDIQCSISSGGGNRYLYKDQDVTVSYVANVSAFKGRINRDQYDSVFQSEELRNQLNLHYLKFDSAKRISDNAVLDLRDYVIEVVDGDLSLSAKKILLSTFVKAKRFLVGDEQLVGRLGLVADTAGGAFLVEGVANFEGGIDVDITGCGASGSALQGVTLK